MGDLIMSYYRGLLYTTEEDLEQNELTFNKYMNSYNIYPIKNRKFLEFNQVFIKNCNNFLELNKQVSTDYLNILEYIKNNKELFDIFLNDVDYKNIKDDLNFIS